ncbi:MAG: hypothetical protein ACU0DW_07105 [Shimia sp.]
MDRLTRRFCFALWAIVVATGAAAQDTSQINAIWRGWMAEYGLTTGQIAIRNNGRLIAEDAQGTASNSPRPLASVSKTVTAACLDAIAPGIWGRPAADFISGAPRVPLKRYAIHAAGLRPDRTQYLRPNTWPGRPADIPIARNAFSHPAGATTVFYNNENYAVLGTVLRSITQDTPSACARALGMPSLRWSTDWRGAGGFGGFAATAREVAQLGEQWSGRRPHRIAVADLPNDTSRAVPGAFLYEGPTPVHGHSGQLCRRDRLLGPRRGDGAWWLNAGGTTIAVTWSGCPPNASVRQLEAAIGAVLARR